jgi:hypothetical protein
MKYIEFLKQPKIVNSFNEKYSELKNYFTHKFEKIGFSKEHNNLISGKIALLNADYLFTEMFEKENEIENEKEINAN